jgi:serine protease Do
MKRLLTGLVFTILVAATLTVQAKGLGDLTPADIALAVSEHNAEIAEKLTPAVVLIYVKGTVKGEQIMPQLPFGLPFEVPRGPQNRQVEGLGSGFIIDGKNGWVLTNNHVVENANEIEVYVFDKDGKETKYKGTDVRTDPKTEVAVLRIEGIEGKVLPEAVLGDSDRLKVGNTILVIGAPFGQAGSVSQGIVSAKGRSGPSPDVPGFERILYRDFIQTDAAINRGNSGGPVIDMSGEVVGISTFIESTNMGSQGVGFAIPINLVKGVVRQLIEEGKVVRWYLGIQMRQLRPSEAKALGVENLEGIYVSQVYSDTPAEKAGLKESDVILLFDGQKPANSTLLQRLVQDIPVGKEVKVRIYRPSEKKEMDIDLKIEEQPEEFGLDTLVRAGGQPAGTRKALGMEVRNLAKEDVERLPVPEDTQGVIVVSVDENSPAYKEEIRKDDIIVEVQWKPVENVDDFIDKVKKDTEENIVLKVLSRDGKTLRGIPNTAK